MPTRKFHPQDDEVTILKGKGWTLRSAAKRLGVSHPHLLRVLKGERQSARLLARAVALPVNRKPPRFR